jgi:mRNA-degrading endonuclease toxin of MazEF toxin-antitoxin module
MPPKAHKSMTEGKAHPTEGKVQATEGKVQATEGKVQARIFAVRSAPTKDLRKRLGKVRAMPRLAAGKGS